MKKNDWYKSFGAADDKYVSEAAPDKVIKTNWARVIISSIAACACFAILVCNLWLFVPYNISPPDVSAYADSEYYPLIKKLNALMYEPPKYKNNASMIVGEVKDFIGGFSALKGIYDNSSGANQYLDWFNGTYEEITDNQVEGIIEADRIKRSSTHIFYLHEDVLRVYSIDKEKTSEVGSYRVFSASDDVYNFNGTAEFYLSSDCRTITVISEYFTKWSDTHFVNIISLDVSDPANIVKKNEVTVTGSYNSSRLTDGSILLLTNFVINKAQIDFDDEHTFVPQIDEGNGFHSLPIDSIVSPDKLTDSRYTVILKLDENTLDVKGTATFVSYSSNVYVSDDHIFVTRGFYESIKKGSSERQSMTEITALAYGGDSFEIIGSATVRGFVKDQWSMDVHNNVLRVFTTTSVSSNAASGSWGVNASLYCIDITSFDIVASVIDFAPPNEEIKSVRFDKECAYVCTAIQVSDPVFFFDLSDINNITYKDTGTIPGFSNSLINMGNGYLLGIGRGNSWDLKIEIYEETETGVEAVCDYNPNYDFSTVYKSYYVDRENQLIGMGVRGREGSRYILVHFDGCELIELVNVELDGYLDNMRGVFIDGYMYMFGASFKVVKVFG